MTEGTVRKKAGLSYRLSKDMARNGTLYLLILPVLAFYIAFSYVPLGGAVIAFKNYSAGKGILGSPWAAAGGLKHFIDFFASPFFWRVIRNTVYLSLYSLLFGFPLPVLFALLLNEVRLSSFKRVVQTISYFPHFVSTVVVCGIITEFSYSDGLFNQIRAVFGMPQGVSFLQEARYFRTIHVATGIWQNLGWNSIIYLAAIAGVDAQLYEAAAIDGAGRWRCMFSITLPGIKNTVMLLLVMQIGRLLSVGYERIILLYNPITYEVADVISSFVYRRGLLEMNYSFSAAVDLFNSAINFALVCLANYASGKLTESSLF